MTNPETPPRRDEPTLTLVRSISDHERQLYMARREAILIELRAIEDYLGIPQTRPSRRSEQWERERLG